MSGGRERAVMVWDARVSLLVQRRDAVESELAHLADIEEPPTRKRREHIAELEAERLRVQRMLAQLGPAPRAKMG
ncbi:MAG TPA: hypothetical protein VF812_18540 [Ktedonobacterales bacterium]